MLLKVPSLPNLYIISNHLFEEAKEEVQYSNNTLLLYVCTSLSHCFLLHPLPSYSSAQKLLFTAFDFMVHAKAFTHRCLRKIFGRDVRCEIHSFSTPLAISPVSEFLKQNKPRKNIHG